LDMSQKKGGLISPNYVGLNRGLVMHSNVVSFKSLDVPFKLK
jgi:hypothetical protein